MSIEPVADDMLRSYFERWQRLEAEKQQIAEDLKELFAEAKCNGFVPKAMRRVFAELTRDDAERAEANELDAVCDLYHASLTRGTRAYTRGSGQSEAA